MFAENNQSMAGSPVVSVKFERSFCKWSVSFLKRNLVVEGSVLLQEICSPYHPFGSDWHYISAAAHLGRT